MSQTELASRLKLHPQVITNWKRRGMPTDKHVEVARVLRVGLEYLITGQSDSSGGKEYRILSKIPVTITAVVDEGGYWMASSQERPFTNGHVERETRDPHAYAIRVIGDAFRPRVKPGEFLIIEPSTAYTSGDDVLIKMRDSRSTVRTFLYARGGVITVQDINEREAPMSIQEIDVVKISYIAGTAKAANYLLGPSIL